MNLQSLKMATKAILVLDNTQNHPEVEFEEAPLIVFFTPLCQLMSEILLRMEGKC